MSLPGVIPQPPEFAARWRAKGYWRDESMWQVFEELLERHSDRAAVIEDGRTTTYAELAEVSARLAANLWGLGLRPLDRVVVQLPNSTEFVHLYLALQRLGVIPIAALPAHRYREVSQFVALADAVAIFAADTHRGFNHAELIVRIARENPCLRHGVLLQQQTTDLPAPLVSLNALIATEPRPEWKSALAGVSVDPDDPAILQLSGGTTGIPKLIPRTHNDYAFNSRLASSVCDIRPDDVLLLILPIEHNLPLACPGLQGFLFAGARVVVSNSTRAADVLPLVQAHGVTHIHVVPALLIAWLAEEGAHGGDLSSVRVIQSGGQRLQPETRTKTEKLFPNVTVQENFGMAEGLLMFVRLDDPDDVRLQTCGRPICPDDEVRLVDEFDADVEEGQVGELICRGPYTLRGYYAAPEHNQRAFTADGFYRSGDLMRQHPSGNFVVEGRRKDLINRGGEKISAEEVENLILTHPDVINVACIPVPDPRLGERMCACVVTKDARPLTLDELCEFLLGHEIAKYKLPERLEILSELPLSNVGKVSKKDLVKRFEAPSTNKE